MTASCNSQPVWDERDSTATIQRSDYFFKVHGGGLICKTDTDSLGNKSTFITLDGSVRDAQPPAPSRNLVARTENGCVLLQWEAALSTDVVGYRLERSDDPTSGFAPLHEGLLPEPQFTNATGAGERNKRAAYRDRRVPWVRFSAKKCMPTRPKTLSPSLTKPKNIRFIPPSHADAESQKGMIARYHHRPKRPFQR
ncbi:MAG: hypothetical protein RhofKO_26580 [Rhodothermales bacterium]